MLDCSKFDRYVFPPVCEIEPTSPSTLAFAFEPEVVLQLSPQEPRNHKRAKMPTDSPSDSAITVVGQSVLPQEKAKDHISSSAPESPLKKSVSQTEAGVEEKRPSTEKPKEEQQPNISGLKRALIILPVTLVYFLVMLDSSIISTVIPQITEEFESLLDVGWYGSAYQLTSSTFVPLAGKIYTFSPTKVNRRYQQRRSSSLSLIDR